MTQNEADEVTNKEGLKARYESMEAKQRYHKYEKEQIDKHLMTRNLNAWETLGCTGTSRLKAKTYTH